MIQHAGDELLHVPARHRALGAVGWVPGWPGAHSQGDTLDEVEGLNLLRENLRLDIDTGRGLAIIMGPLFTTSHEYGTLRVTMEPGMNARCLEIGPDAHLQEVEVPASLRRNEGDDRLLWIVLESSTGSSVVAWLETVGLDPALLRILRDRGHSARLLPLEDAVLFEFPLATDDALPETVLSTLICLDRTVIEIRSDETRSTSSLEDLGSRLAGLPESSTSALICARLVEQSVRVRGRSVELGKRARSLAARMDDAPEGITSDAIVSLKAAIRDLDELVDEQLAMLTLLEIIQRPTLDLVRLSDLFHVAVSNTQSADRAVDRLTNLAADLQGQFDTHQQSKTNRRLAALTIISAIFLPLTLIAGIYGMNFEVMPELHFRYAYPSVLAAMTIVAVGLFWYFWSRGWMKGG
jgi:Mg2+ and Co2+ transporter CorA